MARRATPPGSGYWSAVEASAQGLSQTRRQRIAREMREYLARDAPPVLEVDTPRRTGPLWWPAQQSSPGGVITSYGGTPATEWTAISNGWGAVVGGFSQLGADVRQMEVQLNELRTTMAQVKSDSCDCDEPNNPFWTHSQEGCEFVPRRVELQHVH